MEELISLIKQAFRESEMTYAELNENSFKMVWDLIRCKDILLYISVNSNTVKMFAEYRINIDDENLPDILEFRRQVNDYLNQTMLQVDFDNQHLGVHAANAFGKNNNPNDVKNTVRLLIRKVLGQIDGLYTPVMHILQGSVSPKSAFADWIRTTEKN